MTTAPGNEDGHYSGRVQPIHVSNAHCAPDYHIGTILAYLSRYRKKGGALDLKKSIWFVNQLRTCEFDPKPFKWMSSFGAVNLPFETYDAVAQLVYAACQDYDSRCLFYDTAIDILRSILLNEYGERYEK